MEYEKKNILKILRIRAYCLRTAERFTLNLDLSSLIDENVCYYFYITNKFSISTSLVTKPDSLILLSFYSAEALHWCKSYKQYETTQER